MASPSKPKIKAVFFDFMGTCLDWHSSVTRAFPSTLTQQERSDLALEWRQAFFDDIRSQRPGNAPEDIDVAHARLLRVVLARPANADVGQRFYEGWGGDKEAAEAAAVRAWHSMQAWPDVHAGLERLRSEYEGCELFVLANGTTRLQLDLVRSSGLAPCFDLLFSSQLLGVAKPTPAIYRKALDLVGLGDDDAAGRAVMVAAHAYDLRAAKAVGLQTVYIRRWTDDLDETDPDRLARENEGRILDDFAGLADVIQRL
ncbi:(S)-2-haloacid dehalogenase IVA [Niveomyces insectorum RCEF 264]|uniref:(S)-2-haloacid dehalogenase IVA n=1 Tax=Niveomyces insectorum RCEF 264 TaxID=1081102 RepID=A0A168ABY3_9HYPO|nr:(S)-2-haloacid dehalogenase IVA [Niveomyces insectorum RCEF 264]